MSATLNGKLFSPRPNFRKTHPFEEIVKPWIITQRVPAVVNQEKFHITIVRLAAFFQQFKDFIGFAEARAKPGHVVIMIRRRVLPQIIQHRSPHRLRTSALGEN